jgi:hypothetical protein
MGLVLMTKTEYSRRVQQELTQLHKSFKVIPTHTISITSILQESLHIRDQTIKLIKASLRKIHNKRALLKYLSNNTYNDLPTIRALPKLHKPGHRMRLLLPFNKNIFRTLHAFLAKTLIPISLRLPTSLTSVYELIQTLTQTLLPQDLLVTADLENMYNNINLQLTIELLLLEINKYGNEFFMFGQTHEENHSIWKRIITNSFSRTLFKFEDKIIHQKYGVPMGSPAGPLLATIFINSIIRQQLLKTSLDLSPFLLIKMYIDDGFFIVRGQTKAQAIDLIHTLIRWPNNSIIWESDSIKLYTAQELTTSVP